MTQGTQRAKEAEAAGHEHRVCKGKFTECKPTAGTCPEGLHCICGGRYADEDHPLPAGDAGGMI